MFTLICGVVLIGVAAILDLTFRVRMTRVGYKWALLEGGAFDYRKYHDERKKQGWAAWPVYFMWIAILLGIALIIAGCLIVFGTAPTHSR